MSCVSRLTRSSEARTTSGAGSMPLPVRPTARPKTSTPGSSKPRSSASRMARSSVACVANWVSGNRSSLPDMAEAAPQPSNLDALIERLVAGDAGAPARCITLVEDRELGAIVRQRIRPLTGRAIVVGFTGPPGVGKSTLVDAYIGRLRRAGQSVAVGAVDPSSPLSGGAVLGDRIRMHRHTSDPGVFIRSIASRGHLGGTSENIGWTIDCMDAAGRDVVIIETVGTGQSEVDVAESADTCVVVNAPGLGDDVQAIKAGILEIADVLV